MAVGIGSIEVATEGSVEMIGLGSCVGIFLAVPGKIVAAAHVLLPDSGGNIPPTLGKFADTAVPELLRIVSEAKFAPSRVQASLAGGAQVLQFTTARADLEIGRRNQEAVEALLVEHGIRIVESRTGGTTAISARMPVASGRFTDELRRAG